MQKTILRYSQLTCAVLFGTAVCHVQDVQAGAYGAINGSGVGWASVDVRSSTFKTNKVISPASTSLPSASIKPVVGYRYTTNSPSGASTNTYVRTKATSLGGWVKSMLAATGDGVDGSPEFEARLNVTPVTCAELTVETVINQDAVTENGISGKIEVTTTGTGGTALWLRGFEYTGTNSVPADDLNTPANESIEFLKTNGVWKFETLIVGPFNFGTDGTNGCPLLIPFTLGTTNIDDLIIAIDTMAKSSPFVITCPSDVTFNCGEAVKFPAADVTGGCGQISGTWSPEENYAFPVGTTPVTVTATDENGDTASCTFNVTIKDDQKPLTPTLPSLTYSLCSGTPANPPTPTTTDICAGTTNIIFGTTTNVFPITNTTVVTWTFDDQNGNVTTASQNVTVTGLTFLGFHNPINGTGGSCTNPLVTRTISSSLPIKFDLKCGNTKITGGTPPIVHIRAYDTNCVAGDVVVEANAEYQNDWHYNWNVSGRIGGTYKITVKLPDGTSRDVFVKLR